MRASARIKTAKILTAPPTSQLMRHVKIPSKTALSEWLMVWSPWDALRRRMIVQPTKLMKHAKVIYGVETAIGRMAPVCSGHVNRLQLPHILHMRLAMDFYLSKPQDQRIGAPLW